ncbi:hypothetical protein ACWD0Z_04845 [Streptomyces sp. NPDC003007]
MPGEKGRDLTGVILTHAFWSEVPGPERIEVRSQLKHTLEHEDGEGQEAASRGGHTARARELPPITVVLPDGQEVTGRLQERRQAPGAWLCKVAVPARQKTPQGSVERAWYVVWVQAPGHVKPVSGVSYDDVPTTRLPPSMEQQTLG